jgi:hypothetical protein
VEWLTTNMQQEIGGLKSAAVPDARTIQRNGDDWPIEAYRYHVRPGTPPAPIWQKRPGLPDKR